MDSAGRGTIRGGIHTSHEGVETTTNSFDATFGTWQSHVQRLVERYPEFLDSVFD